MKTINNNTDNVITDDFIKGLTLECFNHAMGTLANEANAAEATEYAKRYFGTDCPKNSIAFALMQGFLWGMAECSRIFTAADDDE